MYKSYRIVDGKPKWIVVNENGDIVNKNPVKEDLKYLKIEFKNCGNNKYGDSSKGCYNDTDTCQRIKEDGNVCGKLLKPGKAHKEYDGEGNWAGNWICKSCYDRDYTKDFRDVANSRTSNLDPNSSQAKGYLFESLTCIWRGVKNLNIENDNYHSSIDHSVDPKLGIIQTKGRFFDSVTGYWSTDFGREWDKKFDYLIFYCANKNGDIIERIYILPFEEIVKRKTIAVVKYDSIGKLYNDEWYEQYRVKDDDTIKIVNDIWKKIIKRKKN